MRRLLFLLSCGVLALTGVFALPDASEEPRAAPAGTFEERVFAMAHAREVVGRETISAIRDAVELTEAARDRAEALLERLPTG